MHVKKYQVLHLGHKKACTQFCIKDVKNVKKVNYLKNFLFFLQPIDKPIKISYLNRLFCKKKFTGFQLKV